MILVDVHAHLDFDDYVDDLDDHVARMRAAGVKAVVVNGVHPKSNRAVLDICERYDLLKPAYGFYPVHVASMGLDAVCQELEWIRAHKPVALGEVGLDYKNGDDNPCGDLHKEVQVEAFRRIIRLGKELDVPLIVHSRKAESDALDVLEEEGARKVVMHCFMGKQKFVLRARNLGFSFSVPVVVTKLEQMQWLVENVPMKQLLTETDSPYMGPDPGRSNSPENVRYSIDAIAKIKGLDAEEVANHVFLNYQRLFM